MLDEMEMEMEVEKKKRTDECTKQEIEQQQQSKNFFT